MDDLEIALLIDDEEVGSVPLTYKRIIRETKDGYEGNPSLMQNSPLNWKDREGELVIWILQSKGLRGKRLLEVLSPLK